MPLLLFPRPISFPGAVTGEFGSTIYPGIVGSIGCDIFQVKSLPADSGIDDAGIAIDGVPVVCDEAAILWNATASEITIAYVYAGVLWAIYNSRLGEGIWTVPINNGEGSRVVGDASYWNGVSFLAVYRNAAWRCLRQVPNDTKFREVGVITSNFDDTVSATFHATRDGSPRCMFYINDGTQTHAFSANQFGEDWEES